MINTIKNMKLSIPHSYRRLLLESNKKHLQGMPYLYTQIIWNQSIHLELKQLWQKSDRRGVSNIQATQWVGGGIILDSHNTTPYKEA